MSTQALLEALRQLDERGKSNAGAAQIREIEAAITARLAEGFTLRKVWSRLSEEGLVGLSFNGFKSAYYRARDAAKAARNDSGRAEALATKHDAASDNASRMVGTNVDCEVGRADALQPVDANVRLEMKPSKSFPDDDGIQVADLPTEIAQVRNVLSFPFDQRDQGACFEAYMRRVNAWLKTRANRGDPDDVRQIGASLMADYPLGASDVPDEEHRTYLLEAFQYLARAEHAAKLGERDEAWSFVSTARFCLGKADGYYTAAYARLTDSRRASKGGKVRMVKMVEAARIECIRLLKELRPDAGWRTQDEAIAGVWPRLEEALKKRGNPFEDVFALVSAWLTHDGEIRDAYQGAAK